MAGSRREALAAAAIGVVHGGAAFALPHLGAASVVAWLAVALVPLTLLERGSRGGAGWLVGGGILTAVAMAPMAAIGHLVVGGTDLLGCALAACPAAGFLVIPAGLSFRGLRVARGYGASRAASIALVLVAVAPTTLAAVILTSTNPPLTAGELVRTWRQPSEARMAQYLAWAADQRHEPLFDAGTPDWREGDCLGDPGGCPVLPKVPLGVPVTTTMSCAATERRCRWTRTDRHAQPVLRGSDRREVVWVVETDLEGRFAGVEARSDAPRSIVRADLPIFLKTGTGFVGTALATCGALVGLLLPLPRRRR